MRSLILTTALLAGIAPSLAHAQACNRACLKSTLDQYLAAVSKHDTAAAPLFVAFRETDNGVVVRPPAGVWQTITGLGTVQRRYLDPVSGQAAYLGTIQEGAATAIATLRIKVDRRQITEAEWIIARPGAIGPSGAPGSNLFNLDGFLVEPPPAERVVPAAQRASREALAGFANSYFDGLTTHDGSVILAHSGCTRNENGTHTAGPNPNPAAAAAKGKAKGPTGDCTSNLTNFGVSLIAARRYPVIDEEQQAVVGFAIFLRKPGNTQFRNLLAEWFFVDTNRIRNIWATMFYPSNDLPIPNWPPYDGTFPVPAEFSATPAGGAAAPAGPGRGKQ